jgi:hypothetical protein
MLVFPAGTLFAARFTSRDGNTSQWNVDWVELGKSE